MKKNCVSYSSKNICFPHGNVAFLSSNKRPQMKLIFYTHASPPLQLRRTYLERSCVWSSTPTELTGSQAVIPDIQKSKCLYPRSSLSLYNECVSIHILRINQKVCQGTSAEDAVTELNKDIFWSLKECFCQGFGQAVLCPPNCCEETLSSL